MSEYHDPYFDDRERQEKEKTSRYFLVVNENGNMQCSCGLPLNKMEEGTYKCSGGYPIYRPGAGEVIIDKFGNLMLKVLPH